MLNWRICHEISSPAFCALPAALHIWCKSYEDKITRLCCLSVSQISSLVCTQNHELVIVRLDWQNCSLVCCFSPIAQIRHFEESLDLKIIWIGVLPNGSIISFQNQWPCKWCMRCVTYLAASLRLFLMKTRFSLQMADRAMGELRSLMLKTSLC